MLAVDRQNRQAPIAPPRLLRILVSGMVVAALSQTSCVVRRIKGPDLDAIYNPSAGRRHVERNPVIVIPGLMGSTLSDEGGLVVWGTFVRKNANPKRSDGARLVALPMREGAGLHELRDGIRPDGVLDRLRVKVLGLPLHLGVYYRVMEMLAAGGYSDEALGGSGTPFTSFQFAYDWRRDLSETAAELAAFIEEKRAYVSAEREKLSGAPGPEVRFDIVAHSMGGLLARYYLRYGGDPLPADGSIPAVTWKGARNAGRVILVATPNAGTISTIRNLVQGVKLGPTFPRYEPAVLGTMPGAYQLLPRGRHRVLVDAAERDRHHEDLYDVELWKELGWGLASPEQDPVLRWLLPEIPDASARRRVALEHLEKSLARARQFAAALDAPARPPAGVSLHLMAGDAVPTPAVLAVDSRSGEIEVVEKRPGDGQVLRTSALMDERPSGEWTPGLISPIHWADVNFVFSGHREMTRDPAFADNVLFILLEQ